MKKLWQFLCHPMLLALIGVLALSAIVWWVGPLIAIGEVRPLDGKANGQHGEATQPHRPRRQGDWGHRDGLPVQDRAEREQHRRTQREDDAE